MPTPKHIWLYIGCILITPLYGQYKHTSNTNKKNHKNTTSYREYTIFKRKGGPELIRNINTHAYAQHHNVTPAQFLYKLHSNTAHDIDIQRYVIYRTAYRVQQRFEEGDTSRDFMLRLAGFYITRWSQENYLPHVVNLAHVLLCNEAIITDLDNETIGKHSPIQRCIFLDKSHIHRYPLEAIITIEHEITHAEHSFTNIPSYIEAIAYPVTRDDIYPLEKFNVDATSHKEYEAEHEAARFAPLPYTMQLHREHDTPLRPYDSHSENRKNIQYPPLKWQRDMFAERSQNITPQDRDWQSMLYLAYATK